MARFLGAQTLSLFVARLWARSCAQKHSLFVFCHSSRFVLTVKEWFIMELQLRLVSLLGIVSSVYGQDCSDFTLGSCDFDETAIVGSVR